MTLRYGILTIGTWDSFFPSSCFSGQNGMLSATEQNQTYNHSFFFRRLSRIQQEDTPSRQSPLPQIQILISFWSQKAEKQKFEIEEKVMSERVKMPNKHFLRSDYLHFFFYLKFLLFVSLVPKISIWLKYHLY